MNDYERGRRDAGIFSEVRYERGAWLGALQSTGGEATILEPINDRYLDGLVAGGCIVRLPVRIAA